MRSRNACERKVNRRAIYNEICPVGQVKYAYANEMRTLPNEPRRIPRLVLKVWANFISCRSVASTFHDKVISCHASDISSKNRTHHFEFFHHNVSDIFLVILTAHPIDISSKGTHNNMGRYIRCFRIRYCRHRISCRKIYRDTYRFL